MPKSPYDQYHWRVMSKGFLRRNPLCWVCEARGKVVPATCVDHMVPHKGDMKKFYDTRNWRAMCLTCHNSKSASNETINGCRVDGSPLDLARQWTPSE